MVILVVPGGGGCGLLEGGEGATLPPLPAGFCGVVGWWCREMVRVHGSLGGHPPLAVRRCKFLGRGPDSESFRSIVPARL